MKRIVILFILFTCTIVLTGCWDKVEIEDRSFVLAIGVDKAQQQEEGTKKRYLLSFVHPDTGKAEEGKVLEYVTFNVTADSFSTGISEILQRFPKVHSYEHTKAIIFGEELLEDPILVKDILDVLNRGHQFHTSMLVYMTEGRAEDIFKVKPKVKSLLAYYIKGIANNEIFAARIGRLTFLDLMKRIYNNEGDIAIPNIKASEDELYSFNVGIIKDYKHIGHLSGKETAAFKWLNNRTKGGVMELNKGIYEIPFTYYSFKRSITLDKVEKGKIYLTYEMETEGSVEENILGIKLSDEKVLSELEKDYEKVIEKECKNLIKKMQEEYKVELLGVREYLYKYQPKLFENISDNFQEYFERNIVIDVKADVKVRRIGKIE